MAQVDITPLRRDPRAQAYQVLRARLLAARKAAGLTQEVLARQLGRSQSFVAKFERGERSIDLIEFLTLARILGFDAAEAIAAVEAEI